MHCRGKLFYFYVLLLISSFIVQLCLSTFNKVYDDDDDDVLLSTLTVINWCNSHEIISLQSADTADWVPVLSYQYCSDPFLLADLYKTGITYNEHGKQ